MRNACVYGFHIVVSGTDALKGLGVTIYMGVTQPIYIVGQSNSRDGQKRAGFLKAKHVWSKTRFEIIKDCEHFGYLRFKTVSKRICSGELYNQHNAET